MLPLLLTAGRMLLAGAAKNAAKGAIAKTVKDKAMDAAKDKVVSIAKDKVKDKKKRISTKKLFAKTKEGGNKIKKGGGLILKKSSAIVKQTKGALSKTSDEKKGGGKGGALVKTSDIRGEILKELEEIKVDFIKVKEISTEKLLNQKQDDKQRYLESRKKKSEEQEKDLEKKKDTKKKKKMDIKGPKIGFFDMIKRFLLNVFIGSLLNYALKFGPIISKMLKGVAEGLTNTWTALKFAIISLTTVFPRQIKFIAKLTAKIIGPPARLIGKLLLKAGRVAGTLFKKAGGVIFNLIKGPLSSLVKKVGGEALEQGAKTAAKGAAKFAGRAAGAVGNALKSPAAAKIINRLKVFSKIFKKVPIVGALIGIGIDLALGEKLDRAVVGAIGATLGGSIGGAIGQGLIPIPGLGAFIGGTVGASIGDWAAKEIYKNLTGRVAEADKEVPLERRAFGGSINVRPSSVPTRTFSKSDSGVQRKTTTTTSLSKQTLNKAKGTLLKDEESAKRFANLSSAYGAIPFVGEAMKLGLDVSLGERVSKARTDAIAESIGSSIGMALKNDEFSVRGFNKRIIGEFSKNLTTWAKRKIFVSVKSQENQFKSLQEKKKEEERSGGAPGGVDGPSTPSGGMLPGSAPPEVKAMLEAISGGEGSWDSVNPSTTVPGLSNMTIADARRAAMQKGYALGGSGAMGKWQQMPEFVIGRAKSSGLNPDKDKFSPENQTKIARMLMASVYPGGEAQLVKDAQKDPLSAAAKLRGTWPSLPGGSQQNTTSKTFVARFNSNISKYKSGTGGGYGFNHHKLPGMAMGGGHTVTSEMGMRNFALSPGMHMGVDISGTTGEPLQAFTDGTVEATSPPSPSAGYGNWVNWVDSNGIGHFYGHMNKPPFVKAGQKIKKGTILGELGSTGKSSGPHLHWEAATNPRDTGRPKNNVLSRFNPLSKYNKESPFGGSIRPDPSMAAAASTSGTTSPESTAPAVPSEFAKNFAVIGDPAANKPGPKGGGGNVVRDRPWNSGIPLTNLTTKSGRSFQVASALAPKFKGFVNDLEKTGYKINDIGGWRKAGSGGGTGPADPDYDKGRYHHPYGASIDINPSQNPYRPDGKLITNFPSNINDIAKKYGLGWGGNWSSSKDTMHFSAGKREGGSGYDMNPGGALWQGKPILDGGGSSEDTSGSGGGGGVSSGGSGVSTPPPEPSEFAKNFAVIGDPSIKTSTTATQVSQTPSYSKPMQSILLAQAPPGKSTSPIRSRSGGSVSGAVSGGVVNSYDMVSRQIISSSMYKL